MRDLKQLAGDLQIPIIAASQLNRAAEDKSPPKLSNLRESGSVEQDSDIVLLLHPETDHTTHLITRKARGAPQGSITLTWIPAYTTFADE
jgi:replicative DNA helicase